MQIKQRTRVIILYHKNNKVLKVIREEENIQFPSLTIVAALLYLAQSYPQDLLIWCEEDFESYLDKSQLKNIFHHHKIMASYGIANENFIPSAIGYVEESPFIKVNKSVSYPTWLMSSDVGGIHASVLLLTGSKIKQDSNFDYFINSVAKLGMRAGLFCYSDPRLLTNIAKLKKRKEIVHSFTLFRFVKQHYKKRWLLILLLNLFVFEKRFPLFAFCYALFFKSRKKIQLNLDVIPVQSTLENTGVRNNWVKQKTIYNDVSSVRLNSSNVRLSLSKPGKIKNVIDKTIDVIIPTIGRKQYLYDVLQDLAKQTHLPEKVIIVEQNPLPDSVSELDYIQKESWPFYIKHIFTHQTGACNARNVALAEVTSEWVFLADDDIRFNTLFFQKTFERIEQYKVATVTTSCLQPNEIQLYNTIHQSGIFGSGNSFVKRDCLKNVQFDQALEFGYGEDTDFGLQLRNQGYDVIYFPDLKITHLKAPMGGFRVPVKKKWESDKIQPKPSPTIMYMKMKNDSIKQIRGYRMVLFFKFYKVQKIKNPIQYFYNFKKQWKKSVYWANELKKLR